MKYLILTVFTTLILSTSLRSQKAAKDIFAELGGPGLASINYDMRLTPKEDGIGFRAGIGGFSVSNIFSDGHTSILLVPVGLNYLLGKDGKNYFELGAGVTLVSTNNTNNSASDGQFTSTFGHLNFGYRLQPTASGFTFRAAINPVFNKEGFVPYYGGISFGYKF